MNRQMDLNEKKTGARAARHPLADRRHFVHKQMERWIRLQQFVFGLPEDYSYAVCVRENFSGQQESSALVRVGSMSWFGHGAGADRQHALAVTLLNTVEAITANSTSVFFHKFTKVLGLNKRDSRRKRDSKNGTREAATDGRELLAG